jgi:chitin disaccharide deacetylase
MTRYALLLALLPALSPAADKKLIVHCDDLGFTHASNVASFEMLEKGYASSASVMMPTPWVAEVVTWAKTHPQADLGLHLTLTSEWKTLRWGPLAAREKVPGLLDPMGYMWQLTEQAAVHATPAEVETELRAQIAHARRIGLRFTHLDTHMGVLYARPDYFQVFEKLGKETGVPILQMKLDTNGRRDAPQNVIDYILSQEARYQKEGAVRLDSLVPDPASGVKEFEARKQAYQKMLRELKPGAHQVIIHPAILGAETTATTGTAVERDLDYRVFGDESTRRLIKETGIQLVGWQDLAKK